MAYPDCTTLQAVDLANRDSNRLVGDANKFVIQKSPYLSAMGKGTMPNVSQVVRWVSFERALPAASLVRPVYVPDENLCGTAGGTDQVGSTEFQGQLKSLRGHGPLICFKTARTSWPQTYGNLVAMLKQGLVDQINADARAAFLDLGGTKATIASTQAFESIFTGAINAIGTTFPNYTPDARPSFRFIEMVATEMRERLGSKPWDGEGGGDEGTGLVIFGQDQIQRFRDEADIREDVRAFVTGRYEMGKDTVQGYRFKGPYRGLMFGVDPYPLRANSLDGSGQPIFIEPLVATNVTVGVGGRPNSNWVSAQYEVGFVLFDNSFDRLTPEDYKVPGFNFPGPMSNDGLRFKLLNDASCHLFEDYGLHLYEMSRAYRPRNPQSACAVLFKRCSNDMSLIAC